MGAGYAQLAAVAAVLAGFATTFLAVVLTHVEHRRRVGVMLALTTATAAGLLVCVVGWSLLAHRYSLGEADGLSQARLVAMIPASAALHRWMSIVFFGSLLALFAVLGLGGWLRSRTLGIVTTGIATAAAIGAWMVIRFFIR